MKTEKEIFEIFNDLVKQAEDLGNEAPESLTARMEANMKHHAINEQLKLINLILYNIPVL